MNLIFFAQALDNSSNDYLESFNKEITDAKNRNELSGRLFTIKQSGETFLKKEEFELTKNQNSILIELDSKEKDNKGRIAPIVCLCEDAFLNVNEFCNQFKKTMKTDSGGFGDRIKRSFDEENINTICNEIIREFNKEEKIKETEAKKRLVFRILCFIGLAYFAYKLLK